MTQDSCNFLTYSAQIGSLRADLRAECVCNSFNYAGGCSWQELDSTEQDIIITFILYADLCAVSSSSVSNLANAAEC